MCGLITMYGHTGATLSNGAESCFKQILYANALRGFDSTGVGRVNAMDMVSVEKDAVPAGSFLYRHQKDAFAFSGKLLVGHNRAATRGAVTAEFAHPHQVKHIMLTHNGTLNNHRALANVDSDSLAIATALANTDDPVEVLKKLDGSFAINWYNSKTKKLYAFRNKERPLTIVKTKITTILISEKKLAEWIFDRNSYAVEYEEDIEPHTLYTFSIDSEEYIKTPVVMEEKKTSVGVFGGSWQNNADPNNGKYTKDETLLLADLKNLGLAEGNEVEVTIYAKLPGNNSNTWHRCVGLLDNDADIEFSVWSDTIEEGDTIICRVGYPQTYREDKYPTMVGYYVRHVIADQTNVLHLPNKEKPAIVASLNGLTITDDIKKKLSNVCSCCNEYVPPKTYDKCAILLREREVTAPKYDPDLKIQYGFTKEKQTYYKLVCEKCTSFFLKADKNWLKREAAS